MTDFVIGFSTPKKFRLFSWLTKVALNTPYSHAYVAFFSESYDRKLIYQASGLAVNFIGESMFAGLENVVGEFTLPVSDSLKTEIIQKAIDTVGEPYGIMHILGLAIYLVCKKFGKTIKVPFQNNSTLVCSQLAAKVIKEISPAYPQLDPETATPKDVYLALAG